MIGLPGLGAGLGGCGLLVVCGLVCGLDCGLLVVVLGFDVGRG